MRGLPPDPFSVYACWNVFERQYDPDFDWAGSVFCEMPKGHEGTHQGRTPGKNPRSWADMHGKPFSALYGGQDADAEYLRDQRHQDPHNRPGKEPLDMPSPRECYENLIQSNPKLAQGIAGWTLAVRRNLHVAREAAGMEQWQLAERLGWKLKKVQQVESTNGDLTFSDLNKYLLATGTFISYHLQSEKSLG